MLDYAAAKAAAEGADVTAGAPKDSPGAASSSGGVVAGAGAGAAGGGGSGAVLLEAVSNITSIKLYSISASAQQSHLLLLGTSMGVMLLSLPLPPTESAKSLSSTNIKTKTFGVAHSSWSARGISLRVTNGMNGLPFKVEKLPQVVFLSCLVLYLVLIECYRSNPK
jgi:hypothetical protein